MPFLQAVFGAGEDAISRLGRASDLASDAANAAIESDRHVEYAYRVSMAALLEVHDLREVTARRDLYRRRSRMGETVVDVAESAGTADPHLAPRLTTDGQASAAADAGGMSARRAWLLAWLGGPLIGIANGTLREVGYKDRVGDLAAHQLSTASALGLFAAYFELLARLRPLGSTRDALQVGVIWLALTVAFEFGFGRGVAHLSWDELLADYDLRNGRLWPLVLAWIALGPAIVRARRFREAATD